MRKILFWLIIILLLITSGFMIAKGLNFGNFEVWGIKQIIAQNDIIDVKNAELSQLVSSNYPNEIKTLVSSAEQMQSSKTEYEDQSILLHKNKNYTQSEEYEIEFLMIRFGNYAKDNNVELKIELTNGQVTGMYNIGFTLTGKYTDITQFIYDIEGDSKLGFKIEDFNMTPNESAVNLQGKFNCKDVRIKISETSIDNINNSNTGVIEGQGEASNSVTTDTNTTNSNGQGQVEATQNTVNTGAPSGTDTTNQYTSNVSSDNTSTEVAQ